MKQTKSQIVAKIRNEVAANYSKRIDELKKQLNIIQEENRRYWALNSSLKSTSDLQAEKIKKLEDWNRRLLEFMDADDPKAAYQEYCKANESQQRVNSIFEQCGRIMAGFGGGSLFGF